MGALSEWTLLPEEKNIPSLSPEDLSAPSGPPEPQGQVP